VPSLFRKKGLFAMQRQVKMNTNGFITVWFFQQTFLLCLYIINLKMGIIRSQSIKSTLITYIGFTIGVINLMFVMPHYLTNSQIGLIQLFVAFATQVVTVGSFGMVVVINKFLPYYKTHLPPKKRDIITIALIIGTIGMFLILGLSFLNMDMVIRKFSKNSPLFINYLYLFPFFAFGYFYYYVFESFNNNYKFTVWSSFVRELFYKIFNLLTTLLFAIGLLSFSGVMDMYATMYWVGAILLILNLVKNDLFYVPFKISSLTKRLRKNVAQYSISAWGISVLSVTSQFIDTFAIAGLQGLGKTAIYSIARFVITTIVMPSSAVVSISIPIISEAWRQNNIAKISEVYKKSALVLMLICGYIFFLIWANINDILHILPDKFYGSPEVLNNAKYVILLLGLARMCDFATSNNNYILQNSKKYYWIDLYSNIFLILMMIPLNYFMIKKFGILGAGYANLIAFFVINTFKTLFLYVKEKMHPFSGKWWLMIAWFAGALLISYVLNFAFHHFLFVSTTDSILLKLMRILLRTVILSAITIPVLYKLKISKDINDLIDSILARISLIYPGKSK
jgi:O-antigen/teichoic acid export membrane protein